jgi:phosphate transport system substrate-binding protein
VLTFLYPILHTAQSIVTFFGGAGPIIVAIVGLFATPYVDQLLIRRERLNYRVLYNSKIGVVPEDLFPPGDKAQPATTPLEEFESSLRRMSMVVIRIRNTGSSVITHRDFREPLSFTFGRRVIWNARIDDATDDGLRDEVRAGLDFFTENDQGEVRESVVNLNELRDQLRARLRGDEKKKPGFRTVRFHTLRLRPGQKFKLVVVLLEPDGGDGVISDEVDRDGKLADRGVIRDEKVVRRVTLSRVTAGLAGVLTVLLVVPSFFPASASQPVECASGELRVEGSSAFIPVLDQLARQYQDSCPRASITTLSNGSVDGVRHVSELNPAQADAVAAVSDGKDATSAAVGLHTAPLAIVPYSMVVNAKDGVDGLTSSQLRGIFDGTYRDWNQLRGGASLPIRIVSRTSGSGGRTLFERNVLKATEPGVTSNGCLTMDRDPPAPAGSVIRCERDTNAEVVHTVGQIPGAIGYADDTSIAAGKETSQITALTIDDKTYDANDVRDANYPFWTVEYFYSLRAPDSRTLLGGFLDYVKHNNSARQRLNDTGFTPCVTKEGAPLNQCNLR